MKIQIIQSINKLKFKDHGNHQTTLSAGGKHCLAPNSKQEIQVSCVERSRWSYDSLKFKTAPKIMDPEMRAAKAASLREDAEGMVEKSEDVTISRR